MKWLLDFFNLIWLTPWLDWLLLTKRPGYVLPALDYITASRSSAWYKQVRGKPLQTVWLGVSVESQTQADFRIHELLRLEPKVRFLSCEPLLGPLKLRRWLQPIGYTGPDEDGDAIPEVEDSYIDWIIVGGESGPGARPCNVNWIRDILQQCADASIDHELPVPCFVKQLGSDPIMEPGPIGLALEDPKGGDPLEWPEDLRIREFPRGVL